MMSFIVPIGGIKITFLLLEDILSPAPHNVKVFGKLNLIRRDRCRITFRRDKLNKIFFYNYKERLLIMNSGLLSDNYEK